MYPSFRVPSAAREPGIHNLDRWLWILGSPHPISGLPEIGNSRCAVAPRNDAAEYEALESPRRPNLPKVAVAAPRYLFTIP